MNDAPSERSRSSVGRMSNWLSKAGTLQAAGQFLRRHLWAWPLIAAAVLGVMGWWVHHSVENSLRQQRIAELNAMVDASVFSMRLWMHEQRDTHALITADEQVRSLVAELRPLADGSPTAGRQLRDAPAQENLRQRLTSRLRAKGYVGHMVVGLDETILAADQDAPIGQSLKFYRRDFVERVLKGETIVTQPYRSQLILTDAKGQGKANLPTMMVVGPVRDEKGQIVAALGLRIRPEDQFTRILEVLRFGESGETFAFDAQGLLLSQSRFDDMMKEIGLLADQPDVRSILTVEVRDPGVNMVEGRRPALRRADQPLTYMAQEAIAGRDGCDADGYRGYRGALRVGAWRWLPEEGMGIATEMDADEAFRPAFLLRRAFWGLMGVLVVGAIVLFFAMIFIANQQRALQQATIAAQQLGQYHLEAKIGAGGMGTIYRARHAMLRRPTAVKLLDTNQLTDSSIARFEREVQLTSSLTHPNTVAVFDYGRTPEGIFYYAMEYLEGLNLDEMVKKYGPLSEARVVFLLRQVCGSLAEAHAAGLVHRDIKPANIVVTTRGGMHDFVKVLDFGLVKSLGPEKADLTNTNALMGTPYYMAPESVDRPDTVDARADVYAVGAVAYFLLTGTTVFSGASVMEICLKHAREEPEPPSQRLGQPISPHLENLILRCLSKAPANRPAEAGQLLTELEACVVTGTWTAREANEWWTKRTDANPALTVALPSPTTFS